MHSCRVDDVYEGDSPMISVEIDTLTFDTVFTAVGSATRSFKIYNHESSDILVDVSLEDPNRSFFRLNVDGISGGSLKEVRIGANDSIYVFADVNIDPDQPSSISPFIIGEWLNVSAGSSSEKVLLEAWGQNANYIPGRKAKGLQSLLSCNMGTISWDDPRPYVIYGLLLIDECEVVLPPGTRIYVHGGVVSNADFVYNDGLIFVGQNGKLTSQGTADQPVVFQGDRLEEYYKERAGQWTGIRLLGASRGNSFKHTLIKNSIVGLRVDSTAQVTLDACEIRNTAGDGLIGVLADIDATNVLVHNNGGTSFTAKFGGNYNMKYCTFSSFGNQSPSVYMDDYLIYNRGTENQYSVVAPLDAQLTNCIIVGSDEDELILSELEGADPDFLKYQLDNCIVTVEDLIASDQYPNFFDNCLSCLRYNFSDPLFVNVDKGDYHLDSLSIAIGKAKPLPQVVVDREGNSRDATMPDIGCHEYQE